MFPDAPLILYSSVRRSNPESTFVFGFALCLVCLLVLRGPSVPSSCPHPKPLQDLLLSPKAIPVGGTQAGGSAGKYCIHHTLEDYANK